MFFLMGAKEHKQLIGLAFSMTPTKSFQILKGEIAGVMVSGKLTLGEHKLIIA